MTTRICSYLRPAGYQTLHRRTAQRYLAAAAATLTITVFSGSCELAPGGSAAGRQPTAAVAPTDGR